MSVNGHLARAARELRRRAADIRPDPNAIARRGHRRTAALAAALALALGVTGLLARQSMDDGSESVEVVPRIQPGSSAPPPITTASSPETCSFPAPATDDDDTTVFVFFFCGNAAPPEEPVAVPRRIPKTENALRVALEELLKGPTKAEQDRGLFSFFVAGPADALKGVVVHGDGTAVVDFSESFEQIPNVSATGAVYSVTRSIEDTVRQFPQITTVAYLIEGDARRWCSLFEAC